MQPSDYIPNEPERNPCHCPVCVALPELSRAARCVAISPLGAEAAPRAPETATQCLARRNALEAPLRGCGCAHCCEAIARLRALSYSRCFVTQPDIPSDRRDLLTDAAAIREIVIACVVDCFAALHPRQRREWFRETIDARAAADEAHRLARESCPHLDEAVRAAAKGYHETDTDAR